MVQKIIKFRFTNKRFSGIFAISWEKLAIFIHCSALAFFRIWVVERPVWMTQRPVIYPAPGFLTWLPVIWYISNEIFILLETHGYVILSFTFFKIIFKANFIILMPDHLVSPNVISNPYFVPTLNLTSNIIIITNNQ